MTQTIGLIGYGLAALGYLFLLLLLLTTRQHSLQRGLLLAVSVIGVIWGTTLAMQVQQSFAMNFSLAADSLRNLAWLTLLGATLSDSASLKALLRERQILVFCGLLLISIALDLAQPYLEPLSLANLLQLQLAQSVLILWLLEQLYRSTNGESRHALKPLTLALGMMYVFDFVVFSDAILTQQLTLEFWYSRGWINMAAIPLILIGVRRAQDRATRIYVSRDIIFHSTLLFAAGAYLLIMASAGYYIRYVGGSWGNMAQLIFFALGGVLLASLFLSDRLRRQVRVFIAKHFFANKYEYRQEWMNFTEVLGSAQGSPYQTALQAMATPFQCKHAILAIQQGSQFKVVANLHSEQSDSESERLLTHLAPLSLKHDWITDIKEMRADNCSYPFSVPAELLTDIERYSFIIPLTSQLGVRGVCLLSSPCSTSKVDWEDRDLMRVISHQLSVFLKLHHANVELAESQQFDTFNRMSAFLVHDLKNVLAQLELLSKNAQRHKHNPDFIDDAFETVDAAAARLKKTLTQLRTKQSSSSHTTPFEAGDAIQQVLTNCANRKPAPLSHRVLVHHLLVADKERFQSVLTHLIQNAQEATANDGEIAVSTSLTPHHFEIELTDSGEGMSQEFIDNRLFKPFDTTKGNAGMGIGAYDAKKFMEQLGGELLVTSLLQQGTTFTLRFPLGSA